MKFNELRSGDMIAVSRDGIFYEKWMFIDLDKCEPLARLQLLYLSDGTPIIEEAAVHSRKTIQDTIGIAGEVIHVFRRGKEILHASRE